MKDLNPQILEEAADWKARLDAPDCTEFEQVRFERWCTQNPDHAAAHAATVGVELDLEILARTDSRMMALVEEAMQPVFRPMASPRRRTLWTVPTSLAAGILITATGFIAYHNWVLPPGEPVTFSTAAREQGNVTLLDGSTVRLDVATSLDVRINERQRAITLRNGRALFVVKPDAERPFSVDTGNSKIVALGTAFQVQRDDHLITVTLTEGAVAVSARNGRLVHQDRLVPGEQLTYSPDASYWVKSKVDTLSKTSWTRGRLVFRGAPLSDVVTEVNRYSLRRLIVGHPNLNSLEVSGTFSLGDSAVTAAGLAALLPIAVEDRGKGDIVLQPQDSLPSKQ